MKIKFDHTKSEITAATGVSKERFDLIYDLAEKSVEKQISEKTGCISKRIEDVVSGLKGTITPAEYVIIGMAVRGSEETIRRIIAGHLLEKFTGGIEMKVEVKTDKKETKKAKSAKK